MMDFRQSRVCEGTLLRYITLFFAKYIFTHSNHLVPFTPNLDEKNEKPRSRCRTSNSNRVCAGLEDNRLLGFID